MDILIKENRIHAVAATIEFGIFDEPNVEKWKLLDENSRLMYYLLDNGFELIEDVTLPEDYVHGKYFYENGEFVLNQEWKPYVSPEERITILEEKNTELETAVIASEQSITDLDLQDIETQQALTDMDLRLMALEG